ncbi:MAG TPA: DUF3592 domain-containing protein [Fibrobacteria bacterium]|nr:DUF3592 domain-containing protein [Fibrobacteria bacterium]HOX50421.1 DUF3592 domain-containing protein [Fibrobacteria bacterium]
MNPATLSTLAKVFGILGTIMGLPFLILGVVFWVMERNFIREAVGARGVVVEVLQEQSTSSTDGTTTTYHYPVFQYQDASGASHRAKSNMGTGSAKVQAGDTVDILYRASDVENVRLAGDTGLFLFAGLFGGFGVFFMTGGLLSVFVFSPIILRKSRPAAQPA